MSKNTGTSELINYFTLGASGAVDIGGNLTLSTIANATTDTDKFLVSDTGIIKYRTGAELLTDIGAAPATGGSYLPLAGGTLTGALNGTSATFSGDLIAASATLNTPAAGISMLLTGRSSDSLNQIRFNSNVGALNNFITSLPASLIIASQGSTPIEFITNNAVSSTPRMSISGAGAVTLTGALNGTSATFSSSVTAGTGGYLISGDNSIFLNNISGTFSQQIKYQNNSTTKFQLYLDSATNSFGVYNNAQSSNSFTLASTGAATFSSSVTATSGILQKTLATSTTLEQMLVINTQFASGIGTGFGGAIVFRGTTAGNENQDNAQIVAYNENASNNGYALGFYTRLSIASGMLQRLTILRDGSVGIGTASPAKKLDVYESSTATVAQYIRNTTINGLLKIDGVSNFQVGTETNHPLFLITNNTTRLTIDSTGGATFSSYVVAQNGFSLPSANVAGTRSLIGGENTNTGATGKVLLLLQNVANSFVIEKYGTGFTSSGIATQAGSAIYDDGAGGISIGATNVSGTLRLFSGNTEQMRIAAGGAVTITNLGTGTVTATAGVLSTVSDLSYKIEDGFIDSALDKVLNLKPRYFYWNEKSGLPMDIRQLGFYAQEVNEALGEEAANTPANKDTPWGITDRSMIAMLTKAVQEQQVQIQELKNKLS